MVKIRKDLAWLIQVEDEFGTKKIRAHVVAPQDNGELHNLSYQRTYDGKESPTAFADLAVSVYLGDLDWEDNRALDRARLWGLVREYKPHHIEHVERARDIMRVLTRIDKALRTAETEAGYLADGDFAGYLARIGHGIGVTTYYIRNAAPVFRDVTGERWRKADMGTIQYWIREVVKLAQDKPGELAQIIRS